jgi:PadR family transcriptional regulator PadR
VNAASTSQRPPMRPNDERGRAAGADDRGEVQGMFEQAVMLSLVAVGGEVLGSLVLGEVRRRVGRRVHSGAVHGTLQRLLRKGLIDSRQDPPRRGYAGAPHRYYRVTHAGLIALRRTKAALDEIWSGVGDALNAGPE